jgi:hypothetical protein
MTIPNGRRALTPRELRCIKHKELRAIVRVALDAGWEVWKTKSNHLRFRPPAGSPRPRVPAGHEDHRGGATSAQTCAGTDSKECRST